MTIIQYFAALLAMGALLAYFVRRIERARRDARDAPPLALYFPFTGRGMERRSRQPTDVRSSPA